MLIINLVDATPSLSHKNSQLPHLSLSPEKTHSSLISSSPFSAEQQRASQISSLALYKKRIGKSADHLLVIPSHAEKKTRNKAWTDQQLSHVLSPAALSHLSPTEKPPELTEFSPSPANHQNSQNSLPHAHHQQTSLTHLSLGQTIPQQHPGRQSTPPSDFQSAISRPEDSYLSRPELISEETPSPNHRKIQSSLSLSRISLSSSSTS